MSPSAAAMIWIAVAFWMVRWARLRYPDRPVDHEVASLCLLGLVSGLSIGLGLWIGFVNRLGFGS